MDLVEEGQQTTTESDRAELYNEAMQIAHDEAPWVYLDYAEELRASPTGSTGSRSPRSAART